MKVCIPVMGQNARLMCLLAHDFYKADYYCLYDLHRDEMEYFSKSDLMARFGLDLKKHNDEDPISAIISPNMRPMAYKILCDNQITVYRPESNLLEENIERLQRGVLSPYDPTDIENSFSCGTSCSSCSTSCST